MRLWGIACVSCSGKQASALALALFTLGARVTLISSAFPLKLPLAIKCVNVQDVQSFDNAINNALHTIDSKKKPIVFMAAALADYAPPSQKGKLKKAQIGEILQLTCHKTKDILASIPPDIAYKVGFKAEIDDLEAQNYAQDMLQAKSAQMVCLNVISEENPFGNDNNSIQLITHKGVETLKGSKFEVALGIAVSLESLLK